MKKRRDSTNRKGNQQSRMKPNSQNSGKTKRRERLKANHRTSAKQAAFPRKSSNKKSPKRSSFVKNSKKRSRKAIPLTSISGKKLMRQNQNFLSVIVTAHNEESTIRKTLNSVMKLRPKEIIVIENGSTDRTLDICKMYPVRCFSFPNRLGHDVGRAIGASKAKGDVLLFLDGDIPYAPSTLLPFVKACYEGADITLNNLDPFYKSIGEINDYVSLSKIYLNKLMARGDLGFCTLTAIPHAMTRNAAQAIGIENLAVPPKAHAIALFKKMRMEKAATVNVFRLNKFRTYHNTIGKMILGDHIEAIHWLQEQTSARVNFADSGRFRAFGTVSMNVREHQPS